MAKQTPRSVLALLDGLTQVPVAEDGGGNGEPATDTRAAFPELRDRYARERVTGASMIDPEDERVQSMIADLDETVTDRLETLIEEPEDRLWPDNPLGEGHPEANEPWRDLQSSYGKFTPLARAYVMPTSAYEDADEIITAIEAGYGFLADYYYTDQDTYGNWWQWQIGIPKAILSTLVLVGEELPDDLVEHHVRAIADHVGEPDIGEGSGDLLSKSDIWVRRGLVEQDPAVMRGGRDPIADTLEYSEQNNIYPDGSTIDHGNIPYSLHYQGRFFVEIATIAHLLRDSPWSLTEPSFAGNIERLYEWAYEVYEPLIWRGQGMSMVVGRHQRHNTERKHGTRLIVPFIRLGDLAPEPHGTRFKEMAKGWIERNTYSSFVDSLSSIPEYAIVSDLLNDDSIGLRDPLIRYKQYYNMDRAVYRDETYAMGLAMLSDRIGNYEVLSDGRGPENGWFTSYGMTYFYTDDLAQYNDGYWYTVDPYSIPGSTGNPAVVDRISPGTYGASPHAGGVEFEDRFGTSSMELVSVVEPEADPAADASTGSTADQRTDLDGLGGRDLLSARKSWFCFGESVLAVGSGITGTSDEEPIRTTVANRNLGREDTGTVTIDGASGPAAATTKAHHEDVKWAHLDRDAESLGYVFPDGAEINVVREKNNSDDPELGTRSVDRWTDESYTRYYLKLALEHGTEPSDEEYLYAVLPDADPATTAAYAETPPIEVLERSSAAHAVRHTELSLTGIQAFEATTIGESSVTVDGPASVMYQVDDDLTIAIADPIQAQERISVELPISAERATEVPDEITVSSTDQVHLVADTGSLPDNQRGQTLTAKFEL